MILLDDKETNLIRGVSAERNMALLEQDEITNIEFVDRQNRTQNKAQLKKVVEWLKRNNYVVCEKVWASDSSGDEYAIWERIDEDEWQSLLKEIE